MLIYGSHSGIASSRIRARLLRLLGCALLALSTLSARAGEVADSPIVSFEIVRFEVQGNTLLPQPSIEAVLAPFTGAKREFSDVERAIEALRAAYHRRGFKLVQVVLPEQGLTDGVVHLQVVEAHIGKVMVEGNRVFDQTNIRRSLPGLREGEVPDLDRISASLKLANESPAKKTTLQLQSSDTPDAVDAQ